MVKFACSTSEAQGTQVQILGADLHTAHQAMLWWCPTYQKERNMGTDVSLGLIFLTKIYIYGERIVSSTNSIGKTGFPHMEELNPYLTPYVKINSKWSKDLNLRPETIKLLEENIGEKLELVWAMLFLDMTPKAVAKKSKSR